MASQSTILGSGAVTVPSDTTANRPTASAGMMRFNTTTNYMEYYDGTAWQSITAPPTITSITPTYYTASGESISIAGANFSTSPVVTLISKTGTSYTAATATYVNNSNVTFTIPSGMDSDNNDPFDVKLTNISGLAYTLAGGLSRSTNPSFTNATGSIGTIYDSQRSSYTLSAVTATDAEGDVTITYSVSSGSLPTGLSLNSSTGAITGTASAVVSDTTSTFNITATGTDSSNSGNTVTATRSFSITVKAPVVTSFTATGANTFSVPTTITSVRVLAIAGGGSGGNGNGAGGGGGAGGYIEWPAYPVTPGGSVPLSVGAGAPYNPGGDVEGYSGTDTVFGTLTAKGGGGGGGWSGVKTIPGGSGGGAAGPGQPTGGTATQPAQPGNSGTYGFGNPGGGGTWPGRGGGGGGAGTAGVYGPTSGNGGDGKSSDITGSSVTRGGGGGGGSEQVAGSVTGGGGGPGGGGAGGNHPTAPSTVGAPGTANTGGGGGCGSWSPAAPYKGGTGGPGVVIVRY